MVSQKIIGGVLSLSSAIALTVSTTLSASAIGFTGAYDPSNFTFSSTPSGAGNSGSDLDTTNAATGTVILYSPDDEFNGLGDLSNNGGATNDWTIQITPARAGTVSFSWAYDTFDSLGSDDNAGYLLNGAYTILGSASGQQSTSPVTITLANGDVFGFRSLTSSNTGGSGQFTVSNFNAQPVPFEFSPTLGLVLLGGLHGYRRYRKHQSRLSD